MKYKNRVLPVIGLLSAALMTLGAGPATAPSTSTAPAATTTTATLASASGPDLSKDKVLYVVGYAHLDTQWRWTYPQTVREYIANTLKNNFPLFEKYPHYVFNFSGSRRYQMMKEYYPEDYAKLKEYVAAGRWFPCGSSVDENDANVPSAESLVRQVLYGNHFFRSEFGKASDEYMLPDCFGFPAALPSVLASCGIKGFSTQKLTWGSAVGIPFKVGVWEGPDGQSVIAALDPGAYTGKVKEDLSQSESWLARINATGAASGAFTDFHYFGTGDRGGAPAEESVDWIEKSVTSTAGPLKVICTRADEMFNRINDEQRAKLPHYKGELLLTEHSSGSITSQAYMKRWNRKNELLADDAERASVAAAWLGGATYPAEKLEKAWTLVLGSQMHDMLPGTSIPKAYEFCWNDELLAANQFQAIASDAVGTVASAMDTQGKGASFVVYNPLSVDRTDVVEATTVAMTEPSNIAVYGPDGKVVPSQIESWSDKDGALKLLFLAHVPSVGWATYDVQPSAKKPEASDELKVGDGFIENGRYKVTLDGNGDVASIMDKKVGREILSAPMRLAFQYENPKQYPAWNMDWNDRKNPPRAYVTGPAATLITEKGPVRATLEVKRQSEGSTFTQRIRLYAGAESDRIEFSNTIDWQTKQSCLKAVIPLTCPNPNATYQIQVGTLERGNNNPVKYEVPQHQWFDLTDTKGAYGVSVLNDCKFGSDKPDDNTVRLTMVYTPGVRAGIPDQATQDFGRHDILYALYAHNGDWRSAGTQMQAARLNQPMIAFASPSHAGNLGKTFSLLKLNTEQVVVQAIKKAEDSDEIIVRLKELNGQAASNVHVQLASAVQEARQVDGQERPIGPAKVADGELVTDVPAYRLMTYALKVAPSATHAEMATNQALELPYDSDVVSTMKNPGDGTFDAAGRSIPADQLPAVVKSEGIEFKIGPTADGEKNAVACNGQKVQLPGGAFNRIYMLAASNDGDQREVLGVDGRPVWMTIQDWSGYIGQWDNRLWQGEMPESGNPSNPMNGLVPGYVKPAIVAWFCSHHHLAGHGDDFYQYCYLYKYAIDIPAGAKSLTLPNNPHIRIMAMTAAHNEHDAVHAATAMFDTLADHVADAPTIVGPGGANHFDDSVRVSIHHPLYWHEGDLHYTVDGSEPTQKSPVYGGPITLAKATTIKARAYTEGREGPVGSVDFDVQDTTPPEIRSAIGFDMGSQIRVTFSEPLDKASAEDVTHYKMEPAEVIQSATLSDDGQSVALKLSTPFSSKVDHWLTVVGIKDCSPSGNAVRWHTTSVTALTPVFSRKTISATRSVEVINDVPNLPVHGHDSWTINMMVRVSKQPANRTLIAGFGATGNELGQGRYLAKFANGIHFWAERSDGESTTAMDLNKWQMLTATYDGQTLTLYKNGQSIGQQRVELADDQPIVQMAPLDPWDKKQLFDGRIRDFTIWNAALDQATLEAMWQAEKQ